MLSLTSVLSDTKVNTLRFGAVLEDTVHANPVWRDLKPEYGLCVPCPDGAGIDQAILPPRLDYDQFNIQAADTMDYSIQRGYSIANTMSWFIPEARGRHDIKFGAQYTNTWVTNPLWSNMNGTYVFRGNQDRAFDPADPRTYPERLNIRVPGARESEMTMHVGEFFVQDKWQVKPGLTFSLGLRYDLELYPYETTAAGVAKLPGLVQAQDVEYATWKDTTIDERATDHLIGELYRNEVVTSSLLVAASPPSICRTVPRLGCATARVRTRTCA